MNPSKINSRQKISDLYYSLLLSCVSTAGQQAACGNTLLRICPPHLQFINMHNAFPLPATMQKWNQHISFPATTIMLMWFLESEYHTHFFLLCQQLIKNKLIIDNKCDTNYLKWWKPSLRKNVCDALSFLSHLLTWREQGLTPIHLYCSQPPGDVWDVLVSSVGRYRGIQLYILYSRWSPMRM